MHRLALSPAACCWGNIYTNKSIFNERARLKHHWVATAVAMFFYTV